MSKYAVISKIINIYKKGELKCQRNVVFFFYIYICTCIQRINNIWFLTLLVLFKINDWCSFELILQGSTVCYWVTRKLYFMFIYVELSYCLNFIIILLMHTLDILNSSSSFKTIEYSAWITLLHGMIFSFFTYNALFYCMENRNSWYLLIPSASGNLSSWNQKLLIVFSLLNILLRYM